MSVLAPVGVKEGVAAERRGPVATVLSRPALLFFILSILFGTAVIVLNPPLRGPDEPAHFLRVHGMARGIILPSTEVDGRKGVYLPADVHDDYAFFNAARRRVWTRGFSYRSVIGDYAQHRRNASRNAVRAPVFVPYSGSEGYSPVSYAPHLIAAFVARLLGLDFLAAFYLMRFAGLVALTAVVAYAIAMTPRLKWAFFLIAMLPAALYGRTVVGADGVAVSFALAITALCLRAAMGHCDSRPGERALWMALCVLSKPPQIAFVLLELMAGKFSALRRRWRSLALVVLPALALPLLWNWAAGVDVAAWRLTAEGHAPAQHFEFGWKLAFMAENPGHFPKAMLFTIGMEWRGLWQQLIGVLGWLDVPLNAFAYPALTLALLLVPFERFEIDPTARLRIVAVLAATVAAYTVTVFLILFITWTPPSGPGVWGIQGRYFINVLPALALLIAAIVNRALPFNVVQTAAVLGALLSGFAALEGLWRIHWVGIS